MDFLHTVIERSRNGIPEVEKSILLHSDIDKHRFQAGLDVLHAAFEDTPNDIHIAFSLDLVLLEHAIFKQGNSSFEFFGIDDNGVTLSGIDIADAESPSDFFKRGLKSRFVDF